MLQCISVMKKTNQYGFSAVEAAVILVVLVALAGGGYFVWHNKHKNGTTNAGNAIAHQSAGNGPSASGGTASSQATTQTATITLPKWNVTFKYDNVGGASLTATWNNQYQGYDFSSTQLGQSANNLCRTEPVLFMDRGQANGVAFRAPDGSATTFAQAAQTQVGNYAKLIGGYYYAVQQPQGSCASNQASTDAQAFNNANAAATSILSLN